MLQQQYQDKYILFKMSQLGYIYSSYGKHFNIGIANTYGENVLTGSNLPKNSIIISSPIDRDNEDLGIYSLIATDNNGSPVRLTYTIQEGNGFKYENDTLYFSIDSNYLDASENYLKVNLSYLFDLNTIYIKNERLSIDIDNLDKISSTNKGVFKIDNTSIGINNNIIYVNTSALDKSNSDAKIYGIGIGDGETVFADNGLFSVREDGLSYATASSPGVIFTTSDKINISDGIISINTENLTKSNTKIYGICTSDENTIKSSNGILSVNEDNLDKGNSSNYGLIKYDSSSININEDKLEVRNYDNFFENINTISSNLDNINTTINDIDYLLKNFGFGIEKATIFKFYCSTLLSTVLEFPEYNEDPDEMDTQIVSIDFVVNTNCPFNISIEYIDNIEPQVTLYEINYADIVVLQGNAGLSTSYQTTEERDLPLKFSFLCKNYYDSDDTEYSINTNIKIRLSYDKDASIYREVIYTLVRFNSGYSELIQKKEEYSDYVIEKETPTRGTKEELENTPFEITINPRNYNNTVPSDGITFSEGIQVSGNEGRTPTFSLENTIDIIDSTGTHQYSLTNGVAHLPETLGNKNITVTIEGDIIKVNIK